MSDYTPPFSISNKMLGFVSSISEKIGKISNYNDFESKPQLRKNNRIKSIYSSLAIEANSLSISEVRDVINGHIGFRSAKRNSRSKKRIRCLWQP